MTRPEMRERLGITMSQDGLMRGVIQELRQSGKRVVISRRAPPGGYRFAVSIEEAREEQERLKKQAFTLLAEAAAIDKLMKRGLIMMNLEYAEDG